MIQKKFFYSIDALLFVFGIALQMQITLFAQDGYSGLRINLADFFLPFAGLWVLFLLVTKRALWPVWSSRYVLPALISLFCFMSIALVHGYYINGAWSYWALINKYAGFLVLLSYFALGSWIMTNSKDMSQTLSCFFKIFC